MDFEYLDYQAALDSCNQYIETSKKNQIEEIVSGTSDKTSDDLIIEDTIVEKPATEEVVIIKKQTLKETKE